MKREYVLAGAVIVVIVVAVGALLVVPGVVAESEEPERDGQLSLRETPITATNATGDEVTLSMTNWLAHSGGPVSNVTLLVRAVDTDTGMVATRTRADIGTVDSSGDHSVVTNVTVERAGEFQMETLVFSDGERIERSSATVSGLAAIRPDVPGSGLNFHRFGETDLPSITYGIDAAGNGSVRMNASAFLTNRGSKRAGALELRVRARQADSNIVADESVVPVSDVRPGRTVRPQVSLQVPDNYTYRLDAVLTRDEVVVDAQSAVADLDPTRNVSAANNTESVELDASDFDDGGTEVDDDGSSERTTTVGEAADGNGPGFGIVAAVLALVGSVLLLARRSQ